MTAAVLPQFSYAQQGRSTKTMWIVPLIWLSLWAAWYFLDAALWILALLALFTLPALYDLFANPSSGCTLDDTEIAWHSGRRHVTLPLAEIDHMRFDTRLDFSVRVTAMLNTGRKVRMPFEATPPHEAFEQAIEARGLRVKRYHFQLLQ